MNDINIKKITNVVTEFDRILLAMISDIEALQKFFKSTDDMKEVGLI